MGSMENVVGGSPSSIDGHSTVPTMDTT
jgi:hypothetical protein